MGPLIWTYADAIRHCERFVRHRGVTLKDGAADHGDLKHAVSAAYRELPGRRPWTYYKRRGRVNLVAPYSTGTIAYDHTGGTYERQLTLSSGTWPTWAVHGEVVIADVSYRVSDRKSSTVITLDPFVNPGADIAAATDYEIFRTYYTLPNNFVSMATPQLETSWGCLSYVSPDVWMANYAPDPTSASTPAFYTFMGDPSLLGNLALHIYPVPGEAQSLDFVYQSRPRPLVQAGYSADETKGYVSTAQDNTTVTGFDTAFDDSMIGSIIRFSSNSKDPPTSQDGYNPRVDERTVISVASATSLTVDAGVNSALTKVKYSVSDPVDIEPGMLQAFLRCCEKHLAHTFDLKSVERIESAYERAYVLACEEDMRSHALRAAGMDIEWLPRATVDM